MIKTMTSPNFSEYLHYGHFSKRSMNLVEDSLQSNYSNDLIIEHSLYKRPQRLRYTRRYAGTENCHASEGILKKCSGVAGMQASLKELLP